MKLQVTNGYRPRFDQISRIIQFIQNQNNKKRIPRSEIVSNLGIPDKQVENLTSMMTGFGLVNPRVSTLTLLGDAICQGDPYFEKIETLWILHYLISSDPRWVVWYRIINQAIPAHDNLTIDLIKDNYFDDLATSYSEKTIQEKLPKEIGATLACYTRTELSRLKILDSERMGHFIKGNPIDIPSLAFLFCMVSFRDRYSIGSSAINVNDLWVGENSPGSVFNIPEFQLRMILGDLHGLNFIRLEQFGNLDQVRFRESTNERSVLENIYGDLNAV